MHPGITLFSYSDCPTDFAIIYHILITKACPIMELNQSGIKFAIWLEHDLVTQQSSEPDWISMQHLS